MTTITILTNFRLFDGEHAVIREGGSVVVEGDTIREVSDRPVKAGDATVIDCAGRFLMPGLIDLHFHAYSATFDLNWLDRMPKPLLVAHALKHLTGAVNRGFTTVRDPGGGDVGLSMAIERRLIDGPRFYYGGKGLSQTGGHGDMRPATHEEPCNCAYSGVITQVVDGPAEVRKVARDELRKGADHIKVFISGGVASPTDPMWMPQFTNDELKAAVEEAGTRRKYVIAHCHTDDGARRCVEVGIRSIDHATIVSDDTAKLIAESGSTYTVPTLAVVHQVLESGAAAGMSPESIAKIDGVLGQMHASIEACRRAGVKIGLGTDIFGTDFHDLQANEFRYRAEVDKPIDILRSATSINAEIMQRKGELGVIAPGAKADMILLDGDPLADLTVFERYRTHMPLIMKGGRVIRDRISSA
jgi:imidazolonepropionase-like amidohydrolase